MGRWALKLSLLRLAEQSNRALLAPTTYPMESLPDELLAAIIRCLSWEERVESAELVSKRWNRVARHSGWSDVTAYDSYQYLSHGNLKVSMETSPASTRHHAHID